MDFHHNDLVTPPSAPSLVENVQAIDPRIALKLALPVGQAPNSPALQDAINAEPSADKAVLLDLASQQLLGKNLTNDGVGNLVEQGHLQSMLANSLSKMDQLGGAALGQMLSDILLAESPELGSKIAEQSKNTQSTPAQSAVVNWPVQAPLVATDPKVAMNNLYQSLQASGLFAADNLRKLLMPSVLDEENSHTALAQESSETQASQYLAQLGKQAPNVSDSVKLLLRGDLLWQGQILPNINARLYREDAWQGDEKHGGQLVKGSRLTMEVNLPNLGPLKIIGTQFGEQIYIAIEVDSQSQGVLNNAFQDLLSKLREQIQDEPQVQMIGQSNGA